MELPKGWPMYCLDLRQVLDKRVFKIFLPKQEEGQHHALADAKYIKFCFDFLEKIQYDKPTWCDNTDIKRMFYVPESDTWTVEKDSSRWFIFDLWDEHNRFVKLITEK